jgi:periplasmic divalent cation tolerance protein
MKPIYIFWTCANIEEARSLSLYLVQKKWVACSSIIPNVESIFCFNDKIQTEQEVKVFLKTIDIHYEKISEIIKEKGSYEVPEITQIACDRLNPAYEKWLLESVS